MVDQCRLVVGKRVVSKVIDGQHFQHFSFKCAHEGGVFFVDQAFFQSGFYPCFLLTLKTQK